ncbi:MULTISPECIES: hypothetical protein [Butyricimonas]|uniref:hypothetical protein n=1 Tax=Butyricimonas TaxID=574697 RepID=UPI0007FB5150|nr:MULTISPECIES: hypothetical protein [Butyricimonas]
MNDKLMKMKVLVLVAIALCSFASVTKATKQQPEQLLIGEETFWMYTLPIEKDSVLSRELQKRLSGRISTGLYRGYVGTWRLEEGKLILEKVVEMSENGGYQEVDISGIFDAYRESGRIVARWFTGTILARGGKYLYWDNDRYEHEILYSLRKGEVKREKRMYNTFQAGSNRNYHGTMNMLFNGNGMVWEGDSILKVEIYPNPDGTVNRVSVWSERDAKKRSRISSERLRAKVERLRKKRNWWEAESRFWARNVSGIKKKRYSRHHPYTREVMACAELMEKWDVLTLDGKIQPARVSIAWGENKGRNWSFDILGKNEQDSLVMEGDTYRVDTYLLQQNPDLITRLRLRLKGAFMEKQPRGYLARWRIADDRLWLVGIRNACTGEVIPLSVLNPGNNGEPLEASWYTGTFEIAKGEVLGQCYPLSRAEKREVVCEVVRGRVVRQSVYDNYIQPGDSVAYNHFIQVIRSHDWDSYPELKGRSLHGRLIVCPRADGVADSIKRIYLYINGGDGTRYHREIDNPSDPWIELVRRTAESVTRWEVCCIQGKVEPVEVWFTLKE